MTHGRSKAGSRRLFLRNEDGSVALEFALVGPILIVLILGVVEATNMLAQDRKIALTNEMMVDYIARLKTVAASDQTTVSQAVDLMMTPYSVNYKASIAIVAFDASGNPNYSSGSAQFAVHGSGYCFTQSEMTTDTSGLSAGSDSAVIGKISSVYEPILFPTFMPQNFSLGALNTQRPREKQVTSSLTTCS